jgi:hypothetical protein
MPTTDEWVKKMWNLYKMEFYSAIKRNEFLSFVGKWMELENILSEVIQVQKAKGCMFSLIYQRQMQYKYKQYHDKQVTLRGGHIREREGKIRKLR